MAILLTQAILDKLANAFGLNSPQYSAFISAASKSPYFAGELNEFGALNWNFKIGEAGKGIYTDASDHKIVFDITWNESPLVLATTLAHEQGHALLPGGTGGPNPNNPADAIANGRTNEGLALLSEYIVAAQLGLTGGSAGHMHSDPDSILTLQLQKLWPGIDTGSLLYNSPAMGTLIDPGSGLIAAGGEFYANLHPSGALFLTYDEFNAGWWMLFKCEVNPDLVARDKIKPEGVHF
jgi:hypothetical protein